jgi:polyphosphate kinase
MATIKGKVKNNEQSIELSEEQKVDIVKTIKRSIKEKEEDKLIRIKMQENLDKYNAEQALKNQE